MTVGVKNGYDEVDIQISVKFSRNIFTRNKSSEILFLQRILRRKHIHETSEKDPNKVAAYRPARARAGRYVVTEFKPSSVTT